MWVSAVRILDSRLLQPWPAAPAAENREVGGTEREREESLDLGSGGGQARTRSPQLTSTPQGGGHLNITLLGVQIPLFLSMYSD